MGQQEGPVTTTTIESETESFATTEAIAATLQLYVDGARTGDIRLLRRAFLADANVRGSYGGKAVDWTLDAFCEAIGKGGPAPDLKARIAMIEFIGAGAVARLEAENWRGARYTDFFVLVEREGAWLIGGKVFFAHSRA
jgi:hypothetical protein